MEGINGPWCKVGSRWVRDAHGATVCQVEGELAVIGNAVEDRARLIAQAPAMAEELEKAAQTIALVRKGIRQRAIQDATIIDTSMDGPSMEMEPLSAILDRALASASALLTAIKGE